MNRLSFARSTKSAPLRLGYIVDSLVTGGAEKLVVTFAEAVCSRPDIDLTVFVLKDQRTPFREMLESAGVEPVEIPGRSIVDPLRFLSLVAALRARSIEYLHAHLTSSTMIGAPAARMLGIPFATTIHNVRPSVRRVTFARRHLYRAALRLPGVHRIAVGHAVAEAAKVDIGSRSCSIISNAVPETAIAPAGAREAVRAELGLGQEELVLIAVGVIIGQKAYEDLLSAFAIAARENAKTVLLIAGHAPETERMERLSEQARQLGISDRVRFLGLRRDVPALLAASDVFVSASHWEGAPVSLLEAMANALPCVVTDVGENCRVLEGTGSMAVPAHDPAALAAALVEMIGNPELRDRAAAEGRRRAFDEYSVSRWVERLLDLYALTGKRSDWRLAACQASQNPAVSPSLS